MPKFSFKILYVISPSKGVIKAKYKSQNHLKTLVMTLAPIDSPLKKDFHCNFRKVKIMVDKYIKIVFNNVMSTLLYRALD